MYSMKTTHTIQSSSVFTHPHKHATHTHSSFCRRRRSRVKCVQHINGHTHARTHTYEHTVLNGKKMYIYYKFVFFVVLARTNEK